MGGTGWLPGCHFNPGGGIPQPGENSGGDTEQINRGASGKIEFSAAERATRVY